MRIPNWLRSLHPAFWVLVTAVSIQVLVGIVTYVALDNWTERSAFGSMFGSVAALFSGLALAGVVYAVLLQRQELSLQRLELELTRRELERSAEAQERSAVLLKAQLDLAKKEAERSARTRSAECAPVFRLQSLNSHSLGATAVLENAGGTVHDLTISIPGAKRARLGYTSSWPSGNQNQLEVLFDSETPPPWEVHIGYTDLYGERSSKTYEFNPKMVEALREVVASKEHALLAACTLPDQDS